LAAGVWKKALTSSFCAHELPEKPLSTRAHRCPKKIPRDMTNNAAPIVTKIVVIKILAGCSQAKKFTMPKMTHKKLAAKE
jgi:hypothetical protein